MCVGKLSLYFQLELNTLGILIIPPLPTEENPRGLNSGERGGRTSKNKHLWTKIDIKCFLFSLKGIHYQSLSRYC